MLGRKIRILLRLSYCGLLGLCAPAAIAQTSSGLYSEPGISPDASKIAFVSGGDIWEVPISGGTARLLVAHAADESKPMYSPDGKYLAFMSTRTGRGDVYILSLATAQLTRLTASDVADELSAWSADSKYIYFHNTGGDIASMNDVYRVHIKGGTPMPVSADRYANEFFAAPSPNNQWVAFAARGISSRQWWRHGSSHLDHAEIWLCKQDQLGKASAYQLFTAPGARDIWPLWSADSKTIFYVSDRGGQENIWSKTIEGQPQQLTKFKDGRVLWPSIDKAGSTIVFERGFELWQYQAATGKASPITVTLGGIGTTSGLEHIKETSGFSNMAVANDGKKLAFVFRGHVFAAPVPGGGNALQISGKDGVEDDLVWNPSGNQIVYTSLRNGYKSLYRYDFVTAKESALTSKSNINAPVFSPDGKWLIYIKDGRELHRMDAKTGDDKLLHKAFFGNTIMFRSSSLEWSPDSRFIAFVSYGPKALPNISVLPVNGGTAIPISFMANGSTGSIKWHPDGKSIFFLTSQRTENVRIAKVDLVPQYREKYSEDEFLALFQTPTPDTAKKTNKKPAVDSVVILADGIRERMQLLPVDISAYSLAISPDGKQLLIGSSVAGQTHLFTYPAKETGERGGSGLRQLTNTSGRKSQAEFSADSKQIYYQEQGRFYVMPIESRVPKAVSITAELDVNFDEEKFMVLDQVWQTLNEGFYDSAFHGVNWKKMHEQFRPLVSKAKTSSELHRLINLMIGELNASHTGISSGGGPSAGTPVGKLGLRFDAGEYEKNGTYRITELVAQGPAALSGKIQVGDYLVSINGVKLTATTNIDQLMENQLGKKTSLELTRKAGASTSSVAIEPISTATEKRLLYRQWVQEQRAYVEKASGGKLGYVHMYDMGAPSLDQLYIDLDAENINKQGVVVDVRNNNGGFVNAYALDVFARKGYMTMTSRGLPSAPARTQLGQRAFGSSTILLTNQHSLSDAEDFTEGYRTLGLGKVVGEPTGGWIIYTSSASMIDGSSIRLPFSRITDNAGKTMELVPRPVDIEARRPIGESYSSESVQLNTAVKTLLSELPNK